MNKRVLNLMKEKNRDQIVDRLLQRVLGEVE